MEALRHRFKYAKQGRGTSRFVFGECNAQEAGIRYFIMGSYAVVNYLRMFAGVIELAILGALVFELFDLCERGVARSRARRSHDGRPGRFVVRY